MTEFNTSKNISYEAWLSSTAARPLLDLELGFLRSGLSDYKGSRALLLGSAVVLDALPLESLGGMVWQLEPQFKHDSGIDEPINFVGDLMFSGLNWPFQDESLDLVLISHSLTAADADSVLMEAWRVLAPEGQLLITAMHDPKCPMFIDSGVLTDAIAVIPEPLLSNRHYCSKLPFSWRGNLPRVISRYYPLHTLQWIKHKPAMIKRLQFKLADSPTAIPAPANMIRGSMNEE